MISRTRAREHALQVLYFLEYNSIELNNALTLFQKHFEKKNDDEAFAHFLLNGVLDHKLHIDEVLEKRMDNWKLSRVAKIDRNILRLGAFEILFTKDIPISVSLDEAVELAKKYGDLKTSAFVNGILDRVAKDFPKEKSV